MAPTTSMLLPHRFTGTSMGTWTWFPEPTPGDPPACTPGDSPVEPFAEESAWATPPAAAIAPVAAATVMNPLRVTCRIADYLPLLMSTWSAVAETGRPRSAWRALRGRYGVDAPSAG